MITITALALGCSGGAHGGGELDDAGRAADDGGELDDAGRAADGGDADPAVHADAGSRDIEHADSGSQDSDAGVDASSTDDAGADGTSIAPPPFDKQDVYIKADHSVDGFEFGRVLAFSDNTLVVGVPNESSNATGVDGDQNNVNAVQSGAAFVYVRDSAGTWTQQAYLKASNTQEGDYFGESVAISGDTIVVGAYQEDSGSQGVDGDQGDNTVELAGAAYVFVRDAAGTWSQQAYLKASNPDELDQFGYHVAISGDTLVVGAHQEDSNATGSNGTQSDDSVPDSGAAYVFTRSGTTWSQQAYLKAGQPGMNALFGASLALERDTLVVGANFESSAAQGVNGNEADQSAAASGAAYVFVREGGTWSQQAYLKASNNRMWMLFGSSVAISGDTAVVGALGESSYTTGIDGDQTDTTAVDSGAAYVFVRSAGTWKQQAYLKASNTAFADRFAESVAIAGNMVAIGTPNEASSAIGFNGYQLDNAAPQSGAVYVFVRSGATWAQQSYLKAGNTGGSDHFGGCVALSSDMLVVGAYSEASAARGINADPTDDTLPSSGAVYAFVRAR